MKLPSQNIDAEVYEERWFKILNAENVAFKGMHNVVEGAILKFIRFQPELDSVLLEKDVGTVSMFLKSVQEVTDEITKQSQNISET